MLVLISEQSNAFIFTCRYFEGCLTKYDNLNDTLMKSLPELYMNIKQEVSLYNNLAFDH